MKDIQVREYPEFKAVFAECKYCGWIEVLTWEWANDPNQTARLFNHVIDNHTYPDGTRHPVKEGDTSGLDHR